MDNMNVYRLVRVFVSSTFRDMDFERDYLKNILIPKLNEEMRQHDILVELCDLRTGLAKMFTSEQEQEEYILQSCFSAIKSTYPYFIALIGDRYGWIPPKQSISNLNQVFQDFGVNSSSVTDKSVTELEIILGCLNKEGSSKSIICFRSDKSYENIPEDILKDYVEEDEVSKNHLAELKEKIKAKFDEWNKNDSIIDYQLEWHENKFIHLEAWGDKVYEILKNQILSDIVPKEDGRSVTQRIMDNFVANNLYKSFDNNNSWNEKATHGIIRQYNKLVFSGWEGVGKSTFLSQHYFRVIHDNTNVMPVFYSLDAPGANRSFNEMIEYLTQQTNKYVLQLYDNHPVYNPDNPLESLWESVDWVARKEYHMLFIIDSYDKIYRHSNPYHHSLRWVPENAAAIIGVDIDWKREFSEDVIVVPLLPLLNENAAKDYIKSMEYNDLTDDIIDKILEPLYKKEEEKEDDIFAYYRTPLWIRMVVDLLVDLNHNDYDIIRSGNRDYTTALKEYREKIIPTKTVFPDELFLEIVGKNHSVIGNEGILLLIVLSLSKYGMREDTLRTYMGMDDIEFTRTLSVTFNKFSKYISHAPETNRWFFKYNICRRSLKVGYGKIFKNLYTKILLVMLYNLKKEGRVDDDIFYFLLCSQNTEDAEALLNDWDEKIIEPGTRDIAEEFQNKYMKEECFNWCMKLLSQGEGITHPKIAFITMIFEKIQEASQIKPVFKEIREITKKIAQEFIPEDYPSIYTVIDFFNLMTDILICEDDHMLASFTNNLAVGYARSASEIPEIEELLQIALKQQQALNQKNIGYRIDTDEYDEEEYSDEEEISETIEQMRENQAIQQDKLVQNPTHKNKLNLIIENTKLAISLFEENFPEAFQYHEEALSLISEVLQNSSEANTLRTCSSYLFKWADKCLKNDYTEMAAAAFGLSLELDEQLIAENETKENLINGITVLNRLICCCMPENEEEIKTYSRKALYLISRLEYDDFDLCCSFWLKQAKLCLEKKAYYEAFFTYDTMGDALTERNDPAYLLVLVKVQINIAEIAFIDGGKDAGMHRMNYALAQIEEMKNVTLNDEDAEILEQLWNRCQEIIRKYS